MLNQQILEATKFFIGTFGFQATQLAIANYWMELTASETIDLLKYQIPRHEQSSADYCAIETRLDAIEKCIKHGIDSIDSAFSGYELAAKSILSLLNANTWDEISNVLKTEQDHLLPEVSDIAFADLVMQPAPDKERLHIFCGWNLVKMCRALGIEEAISKHHSNDLEEAGEEPVREMRILLGPDGQCGMGDVEKSDKELPRPKRWLPVLYPDSLGFLYLNVHSNEEYNQYLNQSLEQDLISSYYGFLSTRMVIEKHLDELILPQVREVLAYRLLPRRYELPSPDQRVAEARLNAIEDCIKDGIDTVFSGYEAATEAVLLLLNADDWNEVREVVDLNRHKLLPKVSHLAFADLVLQPLSDDESDALQGHILGGWNLIQQCRKLGVEAAFEEQLQPRRGTIIPLQSRIFSKLASANPTEVQEGFQEIEPLRRRQEGQAQAQMWDGFESYQAAMNVLAAPEDLPKRIETCRAASSTLDREKMFLLWAMVSLDLADSLRKQLQQQAAPDMTEVISLYQEALTILTPKGEPDKFGHAHH
jgi:hypothetical protein